MARKQVGVAPVKNSTEGATTAYVDLLDGWTQFPSFVPPSTYAVPSPGILSWAATAASATLLSRQYFTPYMVGRNGWTCSGAVIQTTVAAVGGTALTFRVGLYAMDPLTGYPDTTQLLREGTAAITGTAGNLTVTWTGGNIDLTPGTYFVSTIYTYTAAPSTFGTFSMINNQTWQFPNPSGPGLGSIRSIYLAGQTTMKTTSTLPNAFSVDGSTTAVIVFLKRA